MGVDYYNILKVNRNATGDDLRKAYRRLAMLWHPDKHRGDKQIAEAKFKEISEAYDVSVLSNRQRREIYDEYGEEGLKGMPPSSSRRTTPCSTASKVPTNFQFNPRNAEDIFAEAFQNDNHPQKAPTIERKLACTLEELYKGTTRKLKISRNVRNSNGQYVPQSEILVIDIKPGWKKGTKITFPRMGNEEANVIPADIVFVLDEKPHDVYSRSSNDLIVRRKISLGEALGGTTVRLQTLDGRDLAIPLTCVVSPGHELLIAKEGMPIAREPGSKGDLKIKFDVIFPSSLTEEQRASIRNVLCC
ncbi:hypothetical protein KSP40_PGU011914 [Platanthera guangdongensis]|uniref:J domain-containing protein n=1 Tax=Platanthera guangdongensis TaxID=2320717 RepID=A0ABR2LRI2_9ASPA